MNKMITSLNMLAKASKFAVKPSNILAFILICGAPAMASAQTSGGLFGNGGLLGTGIGVDAGASVGTTGTTVGVTIGTTSGTSGGTNVPLDGGLSLLLAAGAGLGVKKYRAMKAERNSVN